MESLRNRDSFVLPPKAADSKWGFMVILPALNGKAKTFLLIIRVLLDCLVKSHTPGLTTYQNVLSQVGMESCLGRSWRAECRAKIRNSVGKQEGQERILGREPASLLLRAKY